MARNQKVDAQAVLEKVVRFGVSQYLDRGEAAALLESQLGGSSSEAYRVRKRIGTQMDHASRIRTDRARIPPLKRRRDCRVRVGDLLRWARQHFKRPFENLPKHPPMTFELPPLESHATGHGSAVEFVFSDNLERCHSLMRSMQAEIERLRDELARCRNLQKEEIPRPPETK